MMFLSIFQKYLKSKCCKIEVGSKLKVGILAFQGDFLLHSKILKKLNVENILVKNVQDLNSSDALIIPGGESTVISKMINLTKITLNLSKKIIKIILQIKVLIKYFLNLNK